MSVVILMQGLTKVYLWRVPSGILDMPSAPVIEILWFNIQKTNSVWHLISLQNFRRRNF